MVVSPLIVGLLLAAALMHASWNALLKAERSDRLATFGMIMTTGTVMGLCAVPFLPWIEAAAWKYLAISIIVHVAYYTFLLKAYSYGDLSHTYPIARGLGPLLVALVSGQLIGEHLRTQDIVGVVLLSFGLITLAIPLKPASGATKDRGRDIVFADHLARPAGGPARIVRPRQHDRVSHPPRGRQSMGAQARQGRLESDASNPAPARWQR